MLLLIGAAQRTISNAATAPDGVNPMQAIKYYTHLPDIVLNRLKKVKGNGQNKWIACCPAHDDKSPSLSIKSTDDRILMHCFTGCHVEDIAAAIGLNVSDLFSGSLSREQRREYKREQYRTVIKNESLFLHMAKHDLQNGLEISAIDKERIDKAVARVRKAKEVLNEL